VTRKLVSKALKRFALGEEFRLPDGCEGTVIARTRPGRRRVSVIVDGSPVGRLTSLPSTMVVLSLGTFSPNYSRARGARVEAS